MMKRLIHQSNQDRIFNFQRKGNKRKEECQNIVT